VAESWVILGVKLMLQVLIEGEYVGMQCGQRTSYASNEGELFNVRDVKI